MVICRLFSLPENKINMCGICLKQNEDRPYSFSWLPTFKSSRWKKFLLWVTQRNSIFPQIGIGENTKTIVLHICFILSSFEKLNLNNLPEVVFLSVMHATGSDVHMPSMSNVCARMPPRNLLIARDTRNCTLWGMQLQYSGACEGSHHVPNWMNLWN